jgi:multidrug efflux pump subunit AcrA (membrane-fusion protein)
VKPYLMVRAIGAAVVGVAVGSRQVRAGRPTALFLLALAAAAGCATTPAVAARTATVHRGTVTRTVSAAGAVAGVGPNGMLVVAPFAEADAVALRPGGPVWVAIEALNGSSRTGTVLAVAPGAVTISGATDYYVTVAVPGALPATRDGQTVRVTASVAEVEGVLVVPNPAVGGTGEWPVVTAVGPDGRRSQTRVVLGAVGDRVTEVRAGLREGQQVLVP